MVSDHQLNVISDPIELLDVSLECAWHTVCAAFDVKAKIPDVQTLLEEIDAYSPEQAAEIILVNMLIEVTECVGRFSPWYKMPARAYGLTSMRDNTTNRIRWMLAPEAIQKWGHLIQDLSVAVQKNTGLLQAMVLVEGLMVHTRSEEDCVIASCNCVPPHTIQIRPSILEKSEIICTTCRCPFSPVDDPCDHGAT